MKKKILILTSNPRNDLKLTREITDLKNVIKRSQNQSQFEIEFEFEVHLEDLQEKFLDYEPRIVHFCGHGTGEQGLVLQNKAEREQKVSTDALSNLFGLFDRQVEGVLLNACYSEVQANAIVRHINYAIGMSHEIRDDAAIAFSTGFYLALSSGRSIEEAYKFGRNAIQIAIDQSNVSRSRSYEDNRKLAVVNVTKSAIIPEHLKPVLKKKSPLTIFPEEIKSANSDRDANLPPQSESDLTPHEQEILEKAVEEEANYKQYRDRARDTWDDFGQTHVVRQPLTQHEYRQRQILLNKVKEFWIEGFLQPSLYANNAINLDWKTNPNAVHRPFEGIKDIPVELDESFEQLQ
ncbi:MAG: CHAT domain-containing protein, partial [Waterburya sp.]